MATIHVATAETYPTTTVSDSAALTFPCTLGTRYKVIGYFHLDSQNDFKVAINAPAGSVTRYNSVQQNSALSTLNRDGSTAGQVVFGARGECTLVGVVEAGDDGNVAIQFASNSAASVTVAEGSWLTYEAL